MLILLAFTLAGALGGLHLLIIRHIEALNSRRYKQVRRDIATILGWADAQNSKSSPLQPSLARYIDIQNKENPI